MTSQVDSFVEDTATFCPHTEKHYKGLIISEEVRLLHAPQEAVLLHVVTGQNMTDSFERLILD